MKTRAQIFLLIIFSMFMPFTLSTSSQADSGQAVGMLFRSTAVPNQSASSLDRLPLADIKAELTKIFETGNASGVSVTIFDSTGAQRSFAFGRESLLSNLPITADKSQFRIDSISKLFTTTAVVDLLEKGLLGLDASILELRGVRFVDFLLASETPERLQKWRKIKVKHLIQHQAGISKDLPDARVFWNSSALNHHSYPSAELLNPGLLKVEFIYEPGATEGAIKYSNLGMNLLARIVEDLNPQKLSFPEYVRLNVFRPMGMNHSAYNFSTSQHPHLVTGFGTRQLHGDPLLIPDVYDVGGYDGSIGAATTSVDLAKFGRQLLLSVLDSSRGSNKIFHSPETAKLILTPPDENSLMTPSRIMANGFFWRFRPADTDLSDNLWVGHTGFGYAFETILLVNPAKGIGVVILANTSADSPAFMMWDAIVAKVQNLESLQMDHKAQALLDDVAIKIRGSLAKVHFQQSIGQEVTKEQLEVFAGRYFADNSIAGPVKTFVVEQLPDNSYALFFILNEKVKFKLYPEDIDSGVFRLEKVLDLLFNNERVEFKFDSAGKVTGVVVAQVKELVRLSY